MDTFLGNGSQIRTKMTLFSRDRKVAKSSIFTVFTKTSKRVVILLLFSVPLLQNVASNPRGDHFSDILDTSGTPLFGSLIITVFPILAMLDPLCVPCGAHPRTR